MRSQIASKQSGAFGERLGKLRTQRGLSQKEVADLIKVPTSTYRDWEYGKKIVGEPYVALAQVFGVSLSELLTGKADSKSQLLKLVDDLDRLVKLLQQTVSSS